MMPTCGRMWADAHGCHRCPSRVERPRSAPPIGMAVPVASCQIQSECLADGAVNRGTDATSRRDQTLGARKVMCMEWPSAASPGDAVIVRQGPSTGVRFVLHGRDGPQIACSTYAEAEGRAASYAEHARASVWYLENGQLQLVCSFVRGHAHDGRSPPRNRREPCALAHIAHRGKAP